MVIKSVCYQRKFRKGINHDNQREIEIRVIIITYLMYYGQIGAKLTKTSANYVIQRTMIINYVEV